MKIIRRLPPVEKPHFAALSIEEIAAANERHQFDDSFGGVFDVPKVAPAAPTIGGWIDVGYNSGATGWSLDY